MNREKTMDQRMCLLSRAGSPLFFILINAFILNALAAFVLAQAPVIKTEKVATPEVYERVLDIVFQDEEVKSHEVIYKFILRFIPYSEPESQIIIRKRPGKIEITEIVSDSGIIRNALTDHINRDSVSDPYKFAKTLKVKKRLLSTTNSQAQDWYSAFFRSINETNQTLANKGIEFDKAGTETIFLHGGFYYIQYKQRSNKMSFGLYDVDIADIPKSSMFSLTKWMANVSGDIKDTN